ncbi:MAG TPA: hypothetical protein VH165_14060 [Kofleriaceae bacterium]|nr:hypothetical protein [Kofleriaceae bacterium]
MTALAAAGPVAVGGILAARAHDASPMLAAPAIVFGVVAATGPALYIATAAAGHAPPLSAVVRAFGTAIGAFGIALAGLILPAAFVALSSVSDGAALGAATGAIGGAGLLGLRRLAIELTAGAPGAQSALASRLVFLAWAAATVAIAGRLWWDLAVEVMS